MIITTALKCLTTVALMATSALGLLATDAPIPGYKVEPLTWEVEAYPNGTMLNLTGTIEQVITQLTQINPDYPHNTNLTSGNSTFLPIGPQCGPSSWGWKPCFVVQLQEGIDYLRTVVGRPTNGPGPGACGRVSCSYLAAIWWCNDNKKEFSLPGFSTIADCAQNIVNTCKKTDTAGRETVVGQNFHADNWNCIVREDLDNC